MLSFHHMELFFDFKCSESGPWAIKSSSQLDFNKDLILLLRIFLFNYFVHSLVALIWIVVEYSVNEMTVGPVALCSFEFDRPGLN